MSFVGVRILPRASSVDACFPTLPTPVDTTYSLPGGTLWTPADSAALQTALNNSVLGDVIQLTAGTVYTGPFTLPVKSGSSWIYIISSALGSLPAAGVRVGPSNVGAMPTLRMPDAGTSIIETVGAVHHYRFVGIHGDVATGFSDTFGRAAMVFGGDATTLANQPHDIVHDRCYYHGRDGTGPSPGTGLSMTRFLLWGGQRMGIVDSYISECHAAGADSQTALVFNGSGPYKFDNCHLEAAGENVLVGGADPATLALLPSDITFTRCYFFKPLGWIGSGWSVKNLLELKIGKRVLIEGCVLQNCWAESQTGFACVFWSVNQDGTAPWSETSDVWMRRCRIRNVAAVFQLTDSGGEVDPTHPGITMNKVRIEHVVAEEVNNVGGLGFIAREVQLAGVKCLQLNHNTLAVKSSVCDTQEYLLKANSLNYTDRNNIYGIATLGVFGDADGSGSTAFNTYCPSASIHRNLFIGDASGSYPADNSYPATHAAVGFVDEANRDYHLSGGSAYKGLADDGTDPGADIDALNTATAGVTD